MGANGTKRQAASAIFLECFHLLLASHHIGRKNREQGFGNLQIFSNAATGGTLNADAPGSVCGTMAL
jgi:hypothetical protein